jgi:glutaminyl-peptide cyclotransferase
MKRKFIASVLVFYLAGCSSPADSSEGSDSSNNSIPLISYSLSKTYPHDTTSFTEGLLVYDGRLYESTGAPEDMAQTRSLFGVVDLTTGRISSKAELDKKKYFGEGIAVLNDKVYQLTYQTKVGFIYDAKNYKQIGQFTFPSKEGWGMTTDGYSLIMSDGTNTLTYLDSSSFAVQKSLSVTDYNGAVTKLNELEYIGDYIYANVYTTNQIVKINPNSGEVVGRLDLTSLAQEVKLKYPSALEMNGIGYDSTKGKVYITGKMWPHIYEITFSIK